MADNMSNIISKCKPDMSHLNSVMGIATVDITTDNIHIIANKLGLKGLRKSKKMMYVTQLLIGFQTNLTKIE